MSLIPTAILSFEMTTVLVDIERNGLCIDEVALREVKKEYEKELAQIKMDLQEIIWRVMGDTPINLDSPEDRSTLFYSRKVKNKNDWKVKFNIGTEMRGATRKKKYPTRMKKTQFQRIVKEDTEVVKRTRAEQCTECDGHGKIAKKRKDGTYGTRRFICKKCKGVGVYYKPTGKVAGLKIIPRTSQEVSMHGFSANSDLLGDILPGLTGDAYEFVEKYTRYSAVTTYLSTFVGGIEKNLRKGFIHPGFNQAVTTTGRLSSSKPNFQNMPRGDTFPVKKAIVSRFKDGKIMDADFAQLEFRVAGFLAQDQKVYQDVAEGADVHRYTASVLNAIPEEEVTKKLRSAAKPDTFKPLYGGTSGTAEQQKYYTAFKKKYDGVAKWHLTLQEEALNTGKVVLPSGREYDFSDTRRNRWGGVTNATTIKNYPVQGFATGDLVPIAVVEVARLMKLHKVKSLMINLVHDSIVFDVHPDEIDIMVKIIKEGMTCISAETLRRYGVVYDMSVGVEISMGENWLETKEIEVFEKAA